MRVRVYRNLHRDCLSVQTYQPGKGWRVVDHIQSINLENVSFHVHEAARRRAVSERRKNVHAFIVGDFSSHTVEHGHKIRYNPYERDSFWDTETGKTIHAVNRVTVSPRGIIADL